MFVLSAVIVPPQPNGLVPDSVPNIERLSVFPHRRAAGTRPSGLQAMIVRAFGL